MRVDRLEVRNFKGFAELTIELHPHFTLLIGENGSGKTSLLEALAVAAGIWLVETPDSTLTNSRREIERQEIRLEPVTKGDRTQFIERRPVTVKAVGHIGGKANIDWTRQIRPAGTRTTNADARHALEIIRDIYARDQSGENVLCPILAYYGAGRAWLPSNKRVPKAKGNGPVRRWSAFYGCFSERIRFQDIQEWFLREATERGNRGGRWRPGFQAVRWAVLQCVPGAGDIWYDSDRAEIVLSIQGYPQPFNNLSAGQRMMFALVADLAIKAVTQNAFLIPAGDLPSGELPAVFSQTPGLILIDELDVHLHPTWQRRVAADLKAAFPSVQFVCTSHSPQVIGELAPEEILLLEDGQVSRPARSLGLDSSRVLEEVMDAKSRNAELDTLLHRLFERIDQEDFAQARRLFPEIETRLGSDDPDLNRARTLMHFLESGE